MSQTLHDFALAAISRHIAEHPRAADTLEGIHFGWIGWDDASAALQLAATETALQELAQRGVLEVHRVGNRLVWRSHSSTDALD